MWKTQLAGVLLLTLATTGCTATDSDTTSAAAVAYSVGSETARCAGPVEPEDLVDLPTAFEGTVTSVAGGVATLQITHTFAGVVSGQAMLSTDEGSSLALGFTKGREYLIAISEGQVHHCLSGPADDEALWAGYDAAFEH